MARLVLPLLLFLSLASVTAGAQNIVPDPATMPLSELERIVPDEHPYGYFVLAIRKFEAGEREDATRWLYIAQIRYRFHIAANPDLPPDGDPAILASLMSMIGQPINEWAGGDVEGWLGSMRAALDWDAANPNGFTSKTKHAAELRTVRAGLVDLIASIEEQRDEIPAERTRNGLENRRP